MGGGFWDLFLILFNKMAVAPQSYDSMGPSSKQLNNNPIHGNVHLSVFFPMAIGPALIALSHYANFGLNLGVWWWVWVLVFDIKWEALMTSSVDN